MKITSITPVLNEEFFIESFIETNHQFVDEMIISDGGSKDNTVDIINRYIAKGYKIKLIHHTQGAAYADDRNQDKYLNTMIELAKDADYIIQLDADEELTNNHKLLKDIIELYPNYNLFGLPLITYWGDKNHVRVNAENDLHWYPTPKYCIFKNIPEIRFVLPTHAFLAYNGDNIFSYGSKIIDIPMIHNHYLKAKENDNRLSDIGGDWQNPNWNIKENEWSKNRFGYQGKYKINVVNVKDLNINIAESVFNTIKSSIKYKNDEIEVLKKSIDIMKNEINSLVNQRDSAINEMNNRKITIDMYEDKINKLKEVLK